MRFSFLCGAILALSSLCGCGSSGGAPAPIPPPPAPDLLSPTVELLANRLIISRLDNGAYDWRQLVTDDDGDGLADPPDTSVPGFQNVTGVSAMGLLCAYAQAPDEIPDALAALEGVKDYLVGVMNDFYNEQNGVTSVSLPNFVFLAKYRDQIGLSSSEWLSAQLAFNKLMLDRDATYGTQSGVISDGIWNRIYDARASIPGIRGWDLSFIYKALLAMDWPQSELDWVAIELVSLPLMPQASYGALGIAHVLEVCALADLGGLCASHESELLALIEPDGSIDGGVQATAYGVLALKRHGYDTSAQETWLLSLIGPAGEMVESDGNEYFEFEGETLEALVFVP